MSELIDTTEMYLRTIYELQEEGIAPLRARIAERLHQSGPTVSQTVARMERDGLLRVHDDRHIELSEHGQRLAIAVMRKHRLAERLLVDVIGLDVELVHEEACRWEHVISEEVEQRLVQILDKPDHSPFGNPIPGLAAIGGASPGPEFRDGVYPLTERVDAVPGESQHVLRRISEYVQADQPTLDVLCRAGLMPGARLSARAEGGTYLVQVAGHPRCELQAVVAEGLFVAGE